MMLSRCRFPAKHNNLQAVKDQSHFAVSPLKLQLPKRLGAAPHAPVDADPNHVNNSNVAVHPELSSELRALYTSLQTCLQLRDKYMGASLQGNMEDNPKNWDAEYCARHATHKVHSLHSPQPVLFLKAPSRLMDLLGRRLR